MQTYAEYDATYDRLMAIGDHSRAQEARIAIALYGMVLTGGDTYEIGDLAVYRNNAKRGRAYLDRNNLPDYPSNAEIAALALDY